MIDSYGCGMGIFRSDRFCVGLTSLGLVSDRMSDSFLEFSESLLSSVFTLGQSLFSICDSHCSVGLLQTMYVMSLAPVLKSKIKQTIHVMLSNPYSSDSLGPT